MQATKGRTFMTISQYARKTTVAQAVRGLRALKPRGLCTAKEGEKAAEATKEGAKVVAAEATGWWSSASFWGAAGAIAGWGMTGAAIWDATQAGPEIISLNMTSVSHFDRFERIAKHPMLTLMATLTTALCLPENYSCKNSLHLFLGDDCLLFTLR